MPLLFLMRLQHVQLPVRVACPEEIRSVSVLVAIGLIEAEIALRKPGAPYASSRLVMVLRITEHGLAEIAKMAIKFGAVLSEGPVRHPVG
ncbi:hypothetical protein V9L20_12580 [Variovorax sp. CCNWLW225]|uniref:hypothetical protein n=1 Tax=Variovorax sp. CCNWLW225 TaxID=3127462 RepID=UPI00307829F5